MLFCGIPLWRRGQANTCAICNSQEHLITYMQNPWPRKGAASPVLLGRGWGCGKQWQEGSLILVWAAMAPLPIPLNSTHPLRLTTPISSLHPLHIPLSTSLAPKRPWTDIITVIIIVYQVDEYRTKHCPALFRSSFVLDFLFVCGFIMEVTRRAIKCMLTGLLGGMFPLDAEQEVVTYITPLI